MANENKNENKTKGVQVTPDPTKTNENGEGTTPPTEQQPGDNGSDKTVPSDNISISREELKALLAEVKTEAIAEAKAELRAEISDEMQAEIKKQAKGAAPLLKPKDEVEVKEVEEKMVTFLPTEDHKCNIGRVAYVFKDEKEQKVPLSVATILSKAKKGYMVKGGA